MTRAGARCADHARGPERRGAAAEVASAPGLRAERLEVTMPLRVDTVADSNALESLAGEWNTLLQRSDSNHPFLTWEWVSTWWSVYGRQARLCVLTARDDAGRLVGIAPLKLQRRRLLGVWRS